MKKLIALIAVIGFITVKSVSAQTAEKGNALKPATEKQADNAETKKEMKSCGSHGTAAKASCCNKSKAKASCCVKHGEEKAEAKELEKEKVKGAKD